MFKLSQALLFPIVEEFRRIIRDYAKRFKKKND